jgi:hypothetical protein
LPIQYVRYDPAEAGDVCGIVYTITEKAVYGRVEVLVMNG